MNEGSNGAATRTHSLLTAAATEVVTAETETETAAVIYLVMSQGRVHVNEVHICHLETLKLIPV